MLPSFIYCFSFFLYLVSLFSCLVLLFLGSVLFLTEQTVSAFVSFRVFTQLSHSLVFDRVLFRDCFCICTVHLFYSAVSLSCSSDVFCLYRLFVLLFPFTCFYIIYINKSNANRRGTFKQMNKQLIAETKDATQIQFYPLSC